MGLISDAWKWVTGHSADTYTDLAKTGVAALSTYASYKDQKAKNELQKQAYDEYMAAAEAAGQEAEAAIDLNLTPMSISGTPTTKAQVTDYTAATGLKHGGISGLRKRYAYGPGEVEVMEMDEEVITPDYLMKEEGVDIGEQVFYNTGRGDRANAFMIWDNMSTPDKSIFDFDFEIFFNDGGWRDMIKGEAPMSQGETQMASAPSMGDSQNDASMQLFNKPYDQLNEMELQMFQEEMSKYMATGGIAGLRNGGRPGYSIGELVEDKETILETPNKEVIEDTDTAFLTGEGVWGIDRAKRIWEILPDDIQGGYGNFMNFFESTDWHGVKMNKGGIAGLRKKYAYGSGEDEVLDIMDEESLGDFEFKMEEGVPIGPMAGPDWYIKRIEHLEYLGYSYEEAGEIAFDDDKYFSIVGMESAIPRGGDPEQPPIYLPKPGQEPQGIQMAAKGGRMGYAMGPGPVMDNTESGIMNLGGMEKDYRFNGGFVPIGEYEKKDDVPARLSKNEFVFTADAVRAAGGGSINKGAKKMYETMKNLEAQPTAKRMTA
jgi:hypothetical protein